MSQRIRWLSSVVHQTMPPSALPGAEMGAPFSVRGTGRAGIPRVTNPYYSRGGPTYAIESVARLPG